MRWNYLVIAVYLAVVFAIGVRFGRRRSSVKKYYTANASIPAWAIGISLMATLISPVTFLAYPGDGFKGTWIRLVQGLMVPPVLVCVLWFIVPCYRRFIGISTYEYFERRFGYGARVYSSLSFLIAHFSKMGSVIFLMAMAIQQVTGMGYYKVVIAVGSLATITTLLGGIEGVIWTEVIQGTVLMGGGLLCAAVLLFKPTGNPLDVLRIAHAAHKITVGPFDLTFSKLTFWVMAANGIFYALQRYAADQTVVQRFLTAKSDRDAIKASLLGVSLCVPVWTLFMFMGTCLWAFYQLTHAALPAGLKPDAVFPHFIKTQLPSGVMGLVMIALISTALSSLQSDLNCLSAAVLDDYYRRLRPAATDRHRLYVGRTIVAVAGACGILMACMIARFGEQNLLAFIFDMYAIFSGGIAGLFVLAFFTTRANRRGLNVGILACILFTAWTFLSSHTITIRGQERLILDLGRFNFTQPQLMVGVWSHIVLFAVGYCASLFFRSEKDVTRMTVYGWLQNRIPRTAATTGY